MIPYYEHKNEKYFNKNKWMLKKVIISQNELFWKIFFVCFLNVEKKEKFSMLIDIFVTSRKLRKI